MGWLNTMLDIGVIGLQMNQRSKLEQLQHQHGQAAAIQVIVQALREEIFNYKQNAEEVLFLETSEPKVAAGAMKVLEVRLKEFGLTPDMFPDLADKEYVASTTKLIQENSRRMIATLSKEDQIEIEQLAHDTLMQPKYDYYLKNYQDVQNYREAQNLVKSKALFNNGFVRLMIMMPVAFILILLFSGLFALVFNDAITGALVGCIATLVGLLYFQKNIAQKKKYKESKKVIKNIQQHVDLELFAQTERELGTNYNQVVQQNIEVENRLKHFFEGSPTIISLPSSSIPSTHCGNCGAELPPKGKFCIKCGQPT